MLKSFLFSLVSFYLLDMQEKKNNDRRTSKKEILAEKDTILGEIQKNDAEKIVVSLKEYQGHKYVDLRIHFLTDAGQWQYTKKGITLNPVKVKNLILLLQKIG